MDHEALAPLEPGPWEAIVPVLDQLPLGVALITPERRILFINRALEALTGFTREEAKGRICANILRGGACLKDCPMHKAAPGDAPIPFAGDIIACDRQKVPVHFTFSALSGQVGQPVFVETLEDLRFLGKTANSTRQAFQFSQLIGRSPEMERVFETLPFIAQTDSSLLITGETGTGKDILAEAIHHASSRAKGPFVKVNCGALPETLLESELFGYRKGAFTGASETKPGRIQLAHKGTLFLTEIGDLSLPLQVKLLSFLDDKVIYPLGDTKGFAADVRLIAATHLNLEEMVRSGSFRKDLLFRLNVIRIHLPPLRERQGDVHLLMEHFFRHFCGKLGKKAKTVSTEALAKLQSYPYPGNVRELRNIMEYACTLCRGPAVEVQDLPPYLAMQEHKDTQETLPTDRLKRTVETALMSDLEVLDRERIVDALLATGGRKSKAAKLMGCCRATLWRKIKQYGLEAPKSGRTSAS